jgi:CO dehydrogenase maturation factor
VGGSELGSQEFVLLDMEASLEHMRRGTVRHVDAMLIVTEPYFRSLETTARLSALAREFAIPRVTAVANKVRNQEEEAAVRDFCSGRGIEVAAVVPFDSAVTDADNAGRPLIDFAPDSTVVRRAEELVDLLVAWREQEAA